MPLFPVKEEIVPPTVNFPGGTGPGALPVFQQQFAIQGFGEVPQMIANCLADLQGGVNSASFSRWFGVNNRANWNKVHSVFTTMQQWMFSKTFNVVSVSLLSNAPRGVAGAVKMASMSMVRSCTGGGAGSTAFGGASHVGSGIRIYLNPATPEFWSISNQGQIGYFALTVVHECCHKIDNTIIDYHPGGDIRQAYNAAWCQHWAGNDPDNAVRNAENYALYCGDINKKLEYLKDKCDGNILPTDFRYTDTTPL